VWNNRSLENRAVTLKIKEFLKSKSLKDEITAQAGQGLRELLCLHCTVANEANDPCARLVIKVSSDADRVAALAVHELERGHGVAGEEGTFGHQAISEFVFPGRVIGHQLRPAALEGRQGKDALVAAGYGEE